MTRRERSLSVSCCHGASPIGANLAGPAPPVSWPGLARIGVKIAGRWHGRAHCVMAGFMLAMTQKQWSHVISPCFNAYADKPGHDAEGAPSIRLNQPAECSGDSG